MRLENLTPKKSKSMGPWRRVAKRLQEAEPPSIPPVLVRKMLELLYIRLFYGALAALAAGFEVGENLEHPLRSRFVRTAHEPKADRHQRQPVKRVGERGAERHAADAHARPHEHDVEPDVDDQRGGLDR